MADTKAEEEEADAQLHRGATRHGDVMEHTDSKWEDYLAEVQENLLQLPLLAMLLPSDVDREVNEVLQSLEKERVHVEVAAHTTYLNMPRTLWILDRDPDEAEDTVTPAKHLSGFVQLVSEKTQDFRAPVGPWIWPLHDSDVASAIVLSEVTDHHAPIWRKALWALRLVPPPTGGVVERCIMEHYGREVGYVFNWANLFARSLWILAVPMLILGILDVGPGSVGAESAPWYCVQVLVIAWGLGVVAFSSSRQAVLRNGAGLRRNMMKAGAEAPRPTAGVQRDPPAAAANSDAAALPHQIPSEKDAAATDGDAARGPPGPADASGRASKPQQANRRVKEKQSSQGVKLAPKEIIRVKEKKMKMHKAVDVAKMEEVFAKHAGPPGKQEHMPDFRLNPEYQPHANIIRQRVVASIITVISLALFLSVAGGVLSVLLETKSLLIYEWGECLRKGCDNAGEKWGALAVLADIGVDIAMALVFIVGLGEACKALSFQLTRLFNFRLMRRRYLMQTMVSLFIECLAKVGAFALLAFLFLPSWDETGISGTTESPDQVCSGFWDYEACRVMLDCDSSNDVYCCSGTLSCARQILPFSSRRKLFENWLVGPFVVAPFVDMVPQVLAPLLAGALSRLADDAETSKGFCAKCCCCACGWLARLLAFIFVLDGEVCGLRYVCLGSTFGPCQVWHENDADEDDAADNLDGALEQALRREFDALDGLKELKLSFLFVMLFAPIQPILVLPTLGARLLEVRSKLPKLFLVKRRNVPRDARLVHGTQETFAIRVVQASFIWHVGLIMVAYNTDLPSADHGMIVGVWVAISIVGVVVLQVLYRLFERFVELQLATTPKVGVAPPALE